MGMPRETRALALFPCLDKNTRLLWPSPVLGARGAFVGSPMCRQVRAAGESSEEHSPSSAPELKPD